MSRKLIPRKSKRLAVMHAMRDPITLPDLCIDMVFSYFEPVQMVGVRRVSKAWRDAVDWRLGREVVWRKWVEEGPLSMDDVGKYVRWEEASLAFRRAVYRYEMKKRGSPTFIVKFSSALQGWCVCGDYFVWANDDVMNIQRVFNAKNPEKMLGPIKTIMCGNDPSGARMRLIMLYPQSSGAAGSPFLVMVRKQVFETGQLPALFGYKFSVVDVSCRKILWSRPVNGGTPINVAFNDKVLVYTKKNYVSGESTELVILNAQTGKEISRVQISTSSRPYILSVKVHPRQELVFVSIADREYNALVFCIKTMRWVGKIKLPVVSLTDAHGIQPLEMGVWNLCFDDFAPTSAGGHETISIYGIHDIIDMTQKAWIIHTFELPTDEMIASEYPEEKQPSNKHSPDQEWIRNWKRKPVEIVLYNKESSTYYDWVLLECINLKAKQVGDYNSLSNTRNIFIHTTKEVHEPDLADDFVISKVPEQVIHPDSFKFRTFMGNTRAVVKKLKKNMPKGTPSGEMREPLNFCLDNQLVWQTLVLKERYMVVGHASEKYYMSFAPNW